MRGQDRQDRSKEGGVFKRLGSRGNSVSARLDSYNQHSHSRYTEAVSESEDSGGGHWKSRSKKKKSSREKDETTYLNHGCVKKQIPSHLGFATSIFQKQSIDSYDDLKKTFLKNYLQQKKYTKDPIELHNIKQRDEESTEDFVRRYKLESMDVKGVPECMRISGFVHEITNPELIKHKGKSKAPPPMTTLVEKRNHAKFCEFHDEVGHNTDEYMHLRKQIEEMLKAGKLSHLITEIKQNNGKKQPKVTKKGETSRKDKALAILMVQPWERVARQRITQSFSHNPEIFFPPLGEDEGTEGPMIIEAEIEGHCVHRIGEIIWPIGQIQLLVKIGDAEHSASTRMNFMVVRSQSSYTGIIERPGVGKLQAVPSIAHGMLKILVEGGVITLKSSKLVPLECAMVFGPEETPSRNVDIFDWKPADMIGVPRHIVEHRLNVREGCSLVRQKKRVQAADRNQVIQEEVGKLVEARIMREVHYHDWLSNPVMVKDSWRMCVDFKDLNKACPKDSYPLPEIDWKVKSLCGFPFKCFLDAYKGYHQIQMATKDEEKTAFITSQGILCYTKIPFGLRNAGATYQCLVDKAFHNQIGRNLEVYVDDLVIKSRTEDEIVRDVEERFKTLREINMKVNPKNWLLGDFHWTTEAEEAFKQMKQLIAELPMLAVPMEKEELIVYLAATKETVSAVLMTKREAKQMPIYFVSVALRGPELNYTSMEKLTLADFIVERPEEESSDTLMEEEGELPEPWILFTNGSSYTDGSGAGLILTNLEGVEFTYALRFWFDATNNEAEYEALIAGLRIAKQMGVKNLQANVDSRLVANQAFSIKQIPRSENKKADALSKIASTSFAHLSKQVLVEELKKKSISEVEILAVVEEEGDTWMTPLLKYLVEGTLPADVKKARAIRHKSWRFGLPGEIISDNEKQSQDDPFKDWCENLRIRQHFASVKHLQTNGLINEDTPFSLTYGMKAVIPIEIGMPTLRTMEVDLVGNNEALEINLDLLEERRKEAAIREAKKAKIEKYYNSKVRNISFKPGDLVYHNNDSSRAEDTWKLGPKWEGPYEITEALEKGAYKLRDWDIKQLPLT
uniref:Reverse transcriptase domain-containing protein n=1 Tax=Tanacetum cinerariifolium TaxID=118510 RepID=A0A699GXB8_TANCI|nr:reverse transcriptase domain-containing protein [Tanacetum cinerariifolium]